MRRSGALLAVALVGWLVILAGVAAFVGGAGIGATPGLSAPASAAIGSGGPTATPALGPLPSPTTGDAVLVGAGDIASCGLADDSATAALVDAIPGTVFTAGDNAYENGTPDEFSRCYDPTWGRFRDRTRPAPGNHDWNTKDAAGYLGYFGAAATNADGDTWYSYDIGTWHVVVLDSDCGKVDGCGADSAQGRWLADDLAASAARCTLAIWHHPRFSSGFHGDDADVEPFWRALDAAGAELVVNGHDHDYERFAPQDASGVADPSGLREFVVGTGGAALRDFGTIAPNSLVRATVAHGVLELTLHPSGYGWRFISVDGTFSDQGSAACH